MFRHMRTFLFTAALLGASLTVGCSKSDSNEASAKKAEDFPAMTMDEVEKGITDKTVTPADCNHPETRKKMGVVPGAILISDNKDFDAKELPADKAAKLVFYCADPG